MGDLAADSISSITCMFNTNSSLIGAATLVDMRIDSTSVWNVDGDAALAGLISDN